MADNATRLKIQASVEGIEGFDSLKRSLQGLAQQGQQSGRSLDRLYTATQQLAGAGKNSVSSLRLQVQALTQLRDAAEIGSRRYRILGQDIERVNRQLRQASATQSAAGGGVGAGLIGGLAARFAAPLAAGAGLAAATGAGMDAEAQQVRLKALTDQYGEYTQAQAAAATVAQTLRLSTAEAEGQFASLYASLRPTGITVRELEDALIGFGAAARNSGASAQETSAAMMQLKQALASGVLQGEELRSIREQAPLVAQAIAKEMGVSIGALKDLAAEGKVTTDVVLRALTKLRDTQLGKLNQQFNTTQQAVTDLGNAFKNTSAELFKLFGPTVVAGLKGLTALLQASANALSLNNKEADISQKARLQAAQDVQKRFPGIEGATALTPRSRAFFDERTQQIAARLRAQALQAPGLTPEQLSDQQSAKQERLNAAAAAARKQEEERRKREQGRAIVLGGLTGGGQADASRGRSSGPHLHAQFGAGVSEAEAIRLIDAALSFGGRTASSFGRSRGYAGHGYPGLDVLTPQDTRFTLRPGYTATDLGIRGALGRGMRVTGPGGSFELGHLAGVTTGKAGQLVNAQQQALNQQAEREQKLAEQRLKDQREYGEKQQEEADQNQSIYNQLQARLQISKAITEEEKIRAEYGAKISDLETRLTEEISNMLDPVQIRIREELRRNEIYQTRIDMLQEIADLQAQQQSEQISAQWQDQQVTLAATLSDYYQQQNDRLQEQSEIAGSLAQTIGQGMQQAFSLAIQGAENLGQSLQELGATVLRDIAQQLLQIAVIAPVVKAIGGIGGGGGIAPIAPGIGALPGGDFSQFFGGAGGGSFAAGLPSAAFTGFGTSGIPGFGTSGIPGFAAGGIMTPQGPVPLRSYARGGIATAPQAAIYGEGSSPEAFIPLPDGRRVPVALKQYPGIPGGPGGGQFESTDQVVQRLVETARQESATRAAAVAASSPDGTVRIKVETTRINSVDYVTAAQAEALAQAAATRSTARQQRALQSSPGARRSLGI
jgi:tape measure domain-containing protein